MVAFYILSPFEWWCHAHSGTLFSYKYPDSKCHGANMGPTWVLSAPDGPHVGPMNLTIRVGCTCLCIAIPSITLWVPWQRHRFFRRYISSNFSAVVTTVNHKQNVDNIFKMSKIGKLLNLDYFISVIHGAWEAVYVKMTCCERNHQMVYRL